MDKIMNLSAFGDIIDKPAEDQFKSKTGVISESGSYGKIFSRVLQNIVQTKLLHWQSHMYGQHKALDELFDGIIDLGDQLAESVMGKYGRPILNEEECCLRLKNFNDPRSGDLSDFMNHLYECYTKECKSLFTAEKDPEILNIIDEIIGLIDKTKYLLTLR